MYIARRELRIPDETGKQHLVKIGDEVKGVEKWDEIARRAIFNLGWVEKVDDPAEPKAAIAAAPEAVYANKTKKKKQSAS